MSFFKEFKEFALKGNAIDLAVGVVIGGAFQAIVNSLVNDIIMPFTALFTGNIDYSNWKIVVAGGAAEIGIGSFINALINFFIIALSIFFAIKYVKKLEHFNLEAVEKFAEKAKRGKKGKMKEVVNEAEVKEETPVEPLVKICPYCLSEIPYRATKCSHCTSELEKVEEN